MSKSAAKCVMIIAGEASGDHHGAKLVQALYRRDPGLFVFGIGGQAMKGVGVRLVADAADIAVVGITEIFSKIGSLTKAMLAAKRLLGILNPDLLILIDFPGFNLQVAATAKQLGIPVLYYVSPQIWAWRSGRVKKIGRRIDHMAVILPFEAAFYQKHRIPVTFVGHPLLDVMTDERRPVVHSDVSATKKAVVGLLPGSREREIARLLPEMLKAARLLGNTQNGLRFIVSIAPTIDQQMVASMVGRYFPDDPPELSRAPVTELLTQCTCVVAASGTVTLEAAIAGVPMVIVYRVSPLSYLLGRLLVKGVKFIGLVNLIAGEAVVPELIQGDANAANIAEKVRAFLVDPDQHRAVQQDLLSVCRILGGSGASAQVAAIAQEMLNQADHQQRHN